MEARLTSARLTTLARMPSLLLKGVLCSLVLAGCWSCAPPVVTGTGCADYGGCDVLEDLADGTSKLIPLRTSSIAEATSRAIAESQRDGVLDAAGVGDSAPHVALSSLFPHWQD